MNVEQAENPILADKGKLIRAVVLEASKQPVDKPRGNPKIATGPPADTQFHFWTYKDLIARRIITSRMDLFRKQRDRNFPRTVKLTGATRSSAALFVVADVKTWINEHLIET